MKKRRMRDYSTDYTYGYTTGYLGMWLMPTKGGERASPEDDCGDVEGRLHQKSEEMWWSHRRRRDVSTGVDHKMGKNVPALKIDGEDDKDNERTTEQRFEVAENNGTEIQGRGEL